MERSESRRLKPARGAVRISDRQADALADLFIAWARHDREQAEAREGVQAEATEPAPSPADALAG